MSELYFAYGSNLNRQDLASWCRNRKRPEPRLEFVSTDVLPDHELAFSYDCPSRKGGVLDVQPRTGHAVEGVVYRVDAASWATLDDKEGNGDAYERIAAQVIDPLGEIVPVFTYKVLTENRKSFVAPHADYVAVVAEGLRQHGLSTVPLECAARNEPTPWFCRNLFVYGTLMRGESRWPLLEHLGASNGQAAHVAGTLCDLREYPGLVRAKGTRTQVRGELWQLRDPCLAFLELDQYEGFGGYDQKGSLYVRTLIEATTRSGEVQRAWCYVYNQPTRDAPVISGGDWRSTRNK